MGGGFDLSSYIPGDDCLIVSNETVAPLYLDALQASLGDKSVEVIALADGEAHKTVATVESVLDKLVAIRANRDASVIALVTGFKQGPLATATGAF